MLRYVLENAPDSIEPVHGWGFWYVFVEIAARFRYQEEREHMEHIDLGGEA